MFFLPLNHYNFCSPHDKTPKVGLKRLELIAQRIHCLLYGPDFLQPQWTNPVSLLGFRIEAQTSLIAPGVTMRTSPWFRDADTLDVLISNASQFISRETIAVSGAQVGKPG